MKLLLAVCAISTATAQIGEEEPTEPGPFEVIEHLSKEQMSNFCAPSGCADTMVQTMRDVMKCADSLSPGSVTMPPGSDFTMSPDFTMPPGSAGRRLDFSGVPQKYVDCMKEALKEMCDDDNAMSCINLVGASLEPMCMMMNPSGRRNLDEHTGTSSTEMNQEQMAEEMQKVFTGMCSKNPKGQYCSIELANLKKIEPNENNVCPLMNSLGCCAGSIYEVLKFTSPDEAAEVESAYNHCGFEAIPKQCVLPGEEEEIVQFDIKNIINADLTDETKNAKVIEEVLNKLAKDLNVSKEQILVSITEDGTGINVFLSPGDQKTVTDLAGTIKDKASDIGNIIETAITNAGAAGSGGVSVDETNIQGEVKTETNEGAKIPEKPDGGSGSSTGGSGSSTATTKAGDGVSSAAPFLAVGVLTTIVGLFA
jgi:hypothetical protein